MQLLFSIFLLFTFNQAFAVSWSYQVNLNNQKGIVTPIDSGRKTFEAGPHICEVTPVSVSNSTEYRSLVCGLDTFTVSTGGLCTQKLAKFSSVQYAILNMGGTKNAVSVVVACKFN